MHPSLYNSNAPDKQLYKQWRRFKNLVEMMEDRGYQIEDQQWEAIASQDAFTEYQRDSGLNTIYQRDDGGLSVIWWNVVGREMGDLIDLMDNQYESEEANSFLIVTIEELNTTWIQELKYQVQVMQYDELALNPTRHILNPPHIVLSSIEAQSFYSESEISAREASGISIQNPVMRYYNAQVGDLIKVRRKAAKTSAHDEDIVYREVRNVSQVSVKPTEGSPEEETIEEEMEADTWEIEGEEQPEEVFV